MKKWHLEDACVNSMGKESIVVHKKKKRKAEFDKNIWKHVLNALLILIPIVAVCFVAGMAGKEANDEESVKTDVFVTEASVESVVNETAGYETANHEKTNCETTSQEITSQEIINQEISKQEIIEPETVHQEKDSVADGIENETNYIYERITWDEDSVAVLGNLEADEETIKQLDKELKKYPGDISIKAVTIDGSKGLSYKSGDGYFVASAVKAPYLLYAYKQMDAGNGTPDEEMKYTGNFYHQGTGVMQYSPVGTVYTLEKIMWNTMRKSDNIGFNMCVERWGKDGYNELMKELNCESFVMEDWTSWIHEGKAEELLIIWNEIYQFMNQGSGASRLMYESCTYDMESKDYNFTKNALPKYTVSQKYGWSEDGYGNGAIIYGENQIYLLVVFMDSSGNARDQQTYTNVVRLINRLMDK